MHAVACDSNIPAHRHTRRVVLPNGELQLAWTEGDWQLDTLCGFAARVNRRRGFLIVSRVLGRHIPSKPSLIRATSDSLARLIPADLPGPVLFVGMAETAITLGQAVHAAWCGQAGRMDSIYIHSTRQQIGLEPLIRFCEPHSHASAHLLYPPDPALLPGGLSSVCSLVLVDDEVTTGSTFVNLVTRLAPLLPRLERTEIAVLTDWSSGTYLPEIPGRVGSHALLHGKLAWEGHGSADFEPATVGSDDFGTLQPRVNLGRLGCSVLDIDFECLSELVADGDKRSLHVIGTGELHYPAFLLGENLEQQGHDVVIQATTRSPARIGEEIKTFDVLTDNYGSGAPTFLYNTCETAGRKRVVCHETAPGTLDPALLSTAGALSIDFGAQ